MLAISAEGPFSWLAKGAVRQRSQSSVVTNQTLKTGGNYSFITQMSKGFANKRPNQLWSHFLIPHLHLTPSVDGDANDQTLFFALLKATADNPCRSRSPSGAAARLRYQNGRACDPGRPDRPKSTICSAFLP
ncbi:hypothetical protein LIA77_04744 [Sarocladium implicatum]|nr:hypothetical protein LIA77_04744 [Sarocladium implicatum]